MNLRRSLASVSNQCMIIAPCTQLDAWELVRCHVSSPMNGIPLHMADTACHFMPYSSVSLSIHSSNFESAQIVVLYPCVPRLLLRKFRNNNQNGFSSLSAVTTGKAMSTMIM